MAQSKTAFERLVAQAVKVDTELKGMDSRPRLTAQAFLAKAKKNAEVGAGAATISDKLLETLATEIRAREADFPHATGFVRKLTKAFIGDGGGYFPVPPVRRLGAYGGEQALSEALSMGTTLLLLVAVAALEAIRQSPESFGSITDMDAHQARRADLFAKRAELYHRIADELTGADVDFDVDGTVAPTVKLSAGEIPLAPKRNLGERLVNWCSAHPGTIN